MSKLLLGFAAAAAINYVSLSLCSLSKYFFTIQATYVLDYEQPPHQVEYILWAWENGNHIAKYFEISSIERYRWYPLQLLQLI